MAFLAGRANTDGQAVIFRMSPPLAQIRFSSAVPREDGRGMSTGCGVPGGRTGADPGQDPSQADPCAPPSRACPPLRRFTPDTIRRDPTSRPRQREGAASGLRRFPYLCSRTRVDGS